MCSNKVSPICPWDSIPMAQTLCIYLIWIYEVVWGGYKPQPWDNGIIFTPQVTLNSQILGQLGQCNGIRVHPHAFDSAYQWLKHFVYNILYISMKQSEVDISLKHDIMALISLHKWPWVPKSWTTLASVTVNESTHMPCNSIPVAQTLRICPIWMYDMVWCEYQPQTWHYGINYTPQLTYIST